jgi:hypothetical protein
MINTRLTRVMGLLFVLLAVAGLVGRGEARSPFQVTGDLATVCGGTHNQAHDHATVCGGSHNSATAVHATVSGGSYNIASVEHAAIGGGFHNAANAAGTTIGGGIYNTAGARYSVVGGGVGNTASGTHATVGGGWQNTASGFNATVAGGGGNISDGTHATVGGGSENTANAFNATVAGGVGNLASADHATVGGGLANQGADIYATVGGGYGNTASGSYATVPGGFQNEAAGDYSFAAGHRTIIDAAHSGTFLLADASQFDFHSLAANEFAVRATGGVRFVTAVDDSGHPISGVRLAPGSGSWSSLSGRALKANLSPVDQDQILMRLAELPISTWNYRSQKPSVRHIGPMAQDFQAAFGMGEDDTHINAVDADGVALAAIQGLYQRVQEQEAQISDQQAQIVALESRIANLENANQVVDSPAHPFPSAISPTWLIFGALCLASAALLRPRS